MSPSTKDIKGKVRSKKEVFKVNSLDEEGDFIKVEPVHQSLEKDGDPTYEEAQAADYLEESSTSPKMYVTPLEMKKNDYRREDNREAWQSISEEVTPKETVKVKFSKFVQLVASHDFSDVIDANPDEDIILHSNLLTELASAKDYREEKKIPLVFLVGIAIGVVLTYILFSK